MHQVLTYSANNAIHEGAKKLSDTELLRKIIDKDLIAQEVKYHKQCYSLFVLKANEVESVPSNGEDCEKFDAFDKMLSMVDHEIFEKRKVLDMKSLLEKYYAILREEGSQQAYRSDKLKSRLEKHYKEKLVFRERGRNKYQLVYSSDISTRDAIKNMHHQREKTLVKM